MKNDDPTLFFESFFDTNERHFFYRGACASPNLLLFVVYKLFSVEKCRLFACLFTQLKGRTGEHSLQPQVVDEKCYTFRRNKINTMKK